DDGQFTGRYERPARDHVGSKRPRRPAGGVLAEPHLYDSQADSAAPRSNGPQRINTVTGGLPLWRVTSVHRGRPRQEDSRLAFTRQRSPPPWPWLRDRWAGSSRAALLTARGYGRHHASQQRL